MRVAGADAGHPVEIRRRYSLFRSQDMILRQDTDEIDLQQQFGFHAVAEIDGLAKPDIDSLCRHHFADFLRIPDIERQRDIRFSISKTADDLGQVADPQCWQSGNGQAAAAKIADFPGGQVDFVEPGERAFDFFKKSVGFGRRVQTLLDPLKQRETRRTLEIADQSANGGLGNVQHFRGPRDRSGHHYRAKRLELAQVYVPHGSKLAQAGLSINR